MNAAAVVVLPGGCGSPDEFFEVLAWRQLGLVRHVAAEGFAEPSVLRFVEAAGDVAALGAGLGARLG